MTPGFILYRAYNALTTEAAFDRAYSKWRALDDVTRAGWEDIARNYDRMTADQD